MSLQSRTIEPTTRLERLTLRLTREYLILGLALVVAVIHGLVYIFVMPPWEHYDEPTHFEYAWLIANKPGLPEVGDYDQTMRRQVAQSMIESGFFEERADLLPDLYPQEGPIWIGIQQLDNPALYYQILAVPLRLFKGLDVTQQLYVGRLVSLLFSLLVVLSAWGIVREVTRPGSPWRWIFPGTVALLPGSAILMTSLNNDVGAIAVFSLFLWGSVRTIAQGISLANLLWVGASAALCTLMKSTVYFAAILVPVVLLFGLFQGTTRKYAWGLLVFGGLALAAVTLSWGDVWMWYRASDQSVPTRMRNERAALGDYAFQVDTKANVNPRWYRPLFQPILREAAVHELAGKTATVGAWIWASEPMESTTPVFSDGEHSSSKQVPVGLEPKFYAYRVEVPENAWRLWITLAPKLDPNGKNVSVYYDGLVLAEGERPIDLPPEFDDPAGNRGVWGGEPFENLLRNPSAEGGGPRLPVWLEEASAKALPIFSGPSFILYYLLDWQGAAWHYAMVGARLFRTFWGGFGWGEVPLLGHKPYRFMLIMTAIGSLGAAVFLWRRRKSIPWAVVLVLGLGFAGIWGGAVLRGSSHFSAFWLWLPVARYGFPAILPTLLILSVGWIEVIRLAGSLIRAPELGQIGVYFGLVFLLDIWSLVSILRYYS